MPANHYVICWHALNRKESRGTPGMTWIITIKPNIFRVLEIYQEDITIESLKEKCNLYCLVAGSAA
jgi:hypothetical protein